MSLHRIKIRNFQSLSEVDLELAPFTVIVGPSSSGKSAFIRAVRTLTSNRRGVDFISHGEKTAFISAETDAGIITLTRSRGTTDNQYLVVPSDPAHPLSPQREFSKLGGDVPVEVSDFLGIEAKDPINYAGQFDKPYLLDDSAGEVARTLGSLTNVEVIFRAAAESNRRKLRSKQQLELAADELEIIKKKIPAFRQLKKQQAALDLADERLAAARDLEKQVLQLDLALQQQSAAAAALQQLQEAAEVEVPDEQQLVEALSHLQQLTAAIKSTAAARAALQQADEQLELAADVLASTELEHSEVLGEAMDTLAGWFGALTQPGDTQKLAGEVWIKQQRALEIFMQYLDTAAGAGEAA